MPTSLRLCPACDRMVPPSHFYSKSGKPRCAALIKWTQAKRFELMGMIDGGWSNAQIARHLGTTEAAVQLARKRYRIPSVFSHALSARDVADIMGVGCSKTVAKWIKARLLRGIRVRHMGPHRTWKVSRDALYAFVEDERTWHLWEVDRITDVSLRRHAKRVRGDVRFLTPGEVAKRYFTSHSVVNSWIHKGYLPARKWGNWWIDERDLERFELPRIGGGAHRKRAA